MERCVCAAPNIYALFLDWVQISNGLLFQILFVAKIIGSIHIHISHVGDKISAFDLSSSRSYSVTTIFHVYKNLNPRDCQSTRHEEPLSVEGAAPELASAKLSPTLQSDTASSGWMCWFLALLLVQHCGHFNSNRAVPLVFSRRRYRFDIEKPHQARKC